MLFVVHEAWELVIVEHVTVDAVLAVDNGVITHPVQEQTIFGVFFLGVYNVVFQNIYKK